MQNCLTTRNLLLCDAQPPPFLFSLHPPGPETEIVSIRTRGRDDLFDNKAALARSTIDQKEGWILVRSCKMISSKCNESR
eukprot:4007676-Pleurochrysis_carterae.AAC.1